MRDSSHHFSFMITIIWWHILSKPRMIMRNDKSWSTLACVTIHHHDHHHQHNQYDHHHQHNHHDTNHHDHHHYHQDAIKWQKLLKLVCVTIHHLCLRLHHPFVPPNCLLHHHHHPPLPCNHSEKNCQFECSLNFPSQSLKVEGQTLKKLFQSSLKISQKLLVAIFFPALPAFFKRKRSSVYETNFPPFYKKKERGEMLIWQKRTAAVSYHSPVKERYLWVREIVELWVGKTKSGWWWWWWWDEDGQDGDKDDDGKDAFGFGREKGCRNVRLGRKTKSAFAGFRCFRKIRNMFLHLEYFHLFVLEMLVKQ